LANLFTPYDDTKSYKLYDGILFPRNINSGKYICIIDANRGESPTTKPSKWLQLNAIGSGTVTSVAASISGALSVSGSPITTAGTLAFSWTGNNTQVVLGDGTLGSVSGGGTVTSVGLSMPSAFSVASSPITTSGTIAVTGVGTTSQYIRGDGSLATFPTIPTVTPSALSRVDDTNVTLTLGGTPLTSLLQATSLTLGWTGTLAIGRGGTGLNTLGTALQQLRVNAGATALEYFTPSASTGNGQITTYITGNGGVLTIGLKGGYTPINRAVTIVGFYIIGDQSGSVQVDIWKVAYSAIPTVANTIFTGANAGSKPTLSVGQVATVTLPATISVSAGDVFAYNIDSATTITGVTIVLQTT
jgi:hypothetical protein